MLQSWVGRNKVGGLQKKKKRPTIQCFWSRQICCRGREGFEKDSSTFYYFVQFGWPLDTPPITAETRTEPWILWYDMEEEISKKPWTTRSQLCRPNLMLVGFWSVSDRANRGHVLGSSNIRFLITCPFVIVKSLNDEVTIWKRPHTGRFHCLGPWSNRRANVSQIFIKHLWQPISQEQWYGLLSYTAKNLACHVLPMLPSKSSIVATEHSHFTNSPVAGTWISTWPHARQHDYMSLTISRPQDQHQHNK